MNISDSERIVTVLEDLGYERTDHEEEADLLGIVALLGTAESDRSRIRKDPQVERVEEPTKRPYLRLRMYPSG